MDHNEMCDNQEKREKLKVDFAYEDLHSWDVPIRDKAVENCLTLNGVLREWIHQGEPFSLNERARLYVVSWMLYPEYYERRTEVEMAFGIGVSRKVFCSMVSSFRDRFGNLNGLVRRDSHRVKLGKIKKAQWLARGSVKKGIVAMNKEKATPSKGSL